MEVLTVIVLFGLVAFFWPERREPVELGHWEKEQGL